MKDCEWGGNISVGKICEKSINYVFLFSYLYREIRTKELQGIVCTFISEFDLPAATKHSSSGAFAKSTTLPFGICHTFSSNHRAMPQYKRESKGYRTLL